MHSGRGPTQRCGRAHRNRFSTPSTTAERSTTRASGHSPPASVGKQTSKPLRSVQGRLLLTRDLSGSQPVPAVAATRDRTRHHLTEDRFIRWEAEQDDSPRTATRANDHAASRDPHDRDGCVVGITLHPTAAGSPWSLGRRSAMSVVDVPPGGSNPVNRYCRSLAHRRTLPGHESVSILRTREPGRG